MKLKNLKQSVVIKTTPEEIYNALMDSKKHSAFTGDTAKISKSVGGKFSAYSGYITGKNIELVPGKKIVQSWHSSDWEEGVFSKVTFLLRPGKNSTKLGFTQTGIPSDDYENVKQGWIDYYWEPMKKMLKKE